MKKIANYVGALYPQGTGTIVLQMEDGSTEYIRNISSAGFAGAMILLERRNTYFNNGVLVERSNIQALDNILHTQNFADISNFML